MNLKSVKPTSESRSEFSISGDWRSSNDRKTSDAMHRASDKIGLMNASTIVSSDIGGGVIVANNAFRYSYDALGYRWPIWRALLLRSKRRMSA